eukprot:gb/GEZJ01000491.1/.p1 GENE.gb/GEZJ01000491.1/~~gb/GEZJ01000491.1/.p1  ORF type:complete len:392 (+),score=41.28 gb/GEZJ01000491.1/:990-2165(+)
MCFDYTVDGQCDSYSSSSSPRVFTARWYRTLQKLIVKKRFRVAKNVLMPAYFAIDDDFHRSQFPPEAKPSAEADVLYQVLAFVQDVSNDLCRLKKSNVDGPLTGADRQERAIMAVWKKTRGISEMLESRYDLLLLRRRGHEVHANLLECYCVPPQGDSILAKTVFEEILKTKNNPHNNYGSSVGVVGTKKPRLTVPDPSALTPPRVLELPLSPSVTTLTTTGSTICFTYVLEDQPVLSAHYLSCPNWGGFKWSYKVKVNRGQPSTELSVFLICHGPENGERVSEEWMVTARFGACAVKKTSSIFANVLWGGRDPEFVRKAIKEAIAMVDSENKQNKYIAQQSCPNGSLTFVTRSIGVPELKLNDELSTALYKRDGKMVMFGYISVVDKGKK